MHAQISTFIGLYILLSIKCLCVEMSEFSFRIATHSYQESIVCANLQSWASFPFFLNLLSQGNDHDNESEGTSQILRFFDRPASCLGRHELISNEGA